MRKIFTFVAFLATLLAACNGENGQMAEKYPVKTDTLDALLARISVDSLDKESWGKLYKLYLDMGDTAEAMNAIGRYTYLVPEDGDAWVEMAWLLADTKDPRAIVITDSLKKVPDPMISSRAAYIGGIYNSNMGRDDRALAIFDSLIVNNYTFLDAYIEKGIILHDRKQYEDALRTFQQAMTVNSTNAEIYFWIGKCHEGLGNLAEAADWRKKYEALR